MSNEISVRELSKSVPSLRKNKSSSMSMEELQEMYASRCLMADFLATKGIPIKCKKRPEAKLDGGDFSRNFRKIAAGQGVRTAYVRSSTDNLLWDMDFLNDNLVAVKEAIMSDVKIDLFGSAT
jgi:hypothetical protein